MNPTFTGRRFAPARSTHVGRPHAMVATLSLAVGLSLGLGSSQAATHPRLTITAQPGYSISWDGNNGGFSSPDAGAGPSNNVALASNGTVPFSSSDLGPLLSIPFHVAANLNDGFYGNSHSWISANGIGGTTDPDPFAGLSFPDAVNVSSIAWSRDNGDATPGEACGGTCTDRAVATYTLQLTQVFNPDGSTPDTGDASTGWETFGTITYAAGTEDASFTSYLRHRFDVSASGSPLSARGLRIKVSSGLTAIDEIEVNPQPDPVPPLSNFIEITPEPGFAVTWDRNEGLYSTPANPAPVPVNDASAARGALPFTSTDLGPAIGVAFHRAINLNDGQYGNAFSWIPNFVGGDSQPFAGIQFGRRILLRNIAWSRDNGNVAGDCCGGTLTDRALGTYEIQVTTVPNPGSATVEACGPHPDSGWVTIARINYKSDNAAFFNSYLRHRFDIAQGGAPIPATGVRIRVPNSSSAIDEIEVNANTAIEQNALRITNAPDIRIVWDGNNGQFSDPAIGAAPPTNQALVSAGTTGFTSSDLGTALNLPFHRAINLNDGLYGNANSWISNGDADPFAGLLFSEAITITNIAWGRDNGNVAGDCCGGTLTDRVLGTYRLQFTTVANADGTTPETGDSSTGWADLGTVTYVNESAGSFTPYLRHRFDLSSSAPIQATAIRIKVSSGAIAIDEIEINTPVNAPAPPAAVVITAAEGHQIVWDGNDGQYFDAAVGAAPPSNRASLSAGTTPFTSSDLGPVLAIPFHVAANLNDGLYGNSFSWISANGIGGNSDPSPFAGLNFHGTVAVTNLAWSRDNGNNTEAVATDRALGLYTLQVTTVESPDASTPETGDSSTGWATVGTIDYRRSDPPSFTPHLRHRFDISEGGQPIQATGLRIKVSSGLMDIDEIEVNTAATLPAPRLTIQMTVAGPSISWTGGGGLEFAPTPSGPWTCAGNVTSPVTVTPGTGEQRFYRVRR